MTLSQIVGLRIRFFREEARMSRAQLAKLRNITQSSIAKQETGERALGEEGLVWYATYFNTTADYILGLTDHPGRPDYEGDSSGSSEPSRGLDPVARQQVVELFQSMIADVKGMKDALKD